MVSKYEKKKKEKRKPGDMGGSWVLMVVPGSLSKYYLGGYSRQRPDQPGGLPHQQGPAGGDQQRTP